MTTIHWAIYLAAGIPISIFAIAGWLFSLGRNQATHVDAMWPLFIAMAAYIFALFEYDLHPRTILVLTLVSFWAIRLCVYLSWRTVSMPTDHRHQLLMAQLQKDYWFKSLYHLFLLYGFLAWIVSLSLFASIQSNSALGIVDVIGVIIVLIGLIVQSIADWQLMQFRRQTQPNNAVLMSGLWGYCRHPNYFGELLVWTGFYMIALSTGAWWSIASLAVMAYLIFFGSGIQAVERNMLASKPGYKDYQRTTNLILPIK